MKSRSVILSLCAVLLFAGTAFANVYDKLQATTCLVDVGKGLGTGVLVTRQVGEVTRTYIWTAGHVVQHLMQPDGTFKNPTIKQEFRDGGRAIGKSDIEAKVIAYSDPDDGEDLALLEVLQDNFRPTTVGAKFDLTGSIQQIGTKLIHVGCTLGTYDSVSLGIISQTDRDLLKTGKMFEQTTVMGYPGSSGGGVYLEDGKYIGMLTQGAGPGLNFIIPMRRIIPWAKKMGILWALNPETPVAAVPKLTDGTEKLPPDYSGACVLNPDDESGDNADDDSGDSAIYRPAA
jgi:S1-C subfamily serine protease